MDSSIFTSFHVAISVIAILSGLAVMYGLLTANRMRAMTMLFLVTTIATSVTGYFFHRDHILPSHIVGAISLIVLAVSCVALYAFHLRSGWRRAYVVCAVLALYLNVFVLVVQLFLKVASLHALAPNGSEPPFVAVQAVLLLSFVVLAVLALRRFRLAVA